jgi:hypothetical protein
VAGAVSRLPKYIHSGSSFPIDFMFQITKAEYENLKSQNATSSSLDNVLPVKWMLQNIAFVFKNNTFVNVQTTTAWQKA